MLQITTQEQLTKVLEEHSRVIIDLFTTWCGPCKVLGPKLEELSQEYKGENGVLFCKVDLTRPKPGQGPNMMIETELGESVTTVPTIVAYRNGREIQRIAGANFSAIVEMAEKLRE